MAAINATEAEIARLRAVVGVDAPTPSGDTTAALHLDEQQDQDFHVTIAQCSRNPMLTELLCGELYPLLRLYRGLPPGRRPRGRRAVVEHERIVCAIEDRDPDLAELLMRRHIAAARRRREFALAEAGAARPMVPAGRSPSSGGAASDRTGRPPAANSA